MSIEEQIQAYIDTLAEPKRSEMYELHKLILDANSGCQLWFLDGKNAENKVVSNPNIGYGSITMHYAGGKTRDFYKIGLSANTTGISVYVMGLEDKNYLVNALGKRLGKASISGYCIKFKSLKDIHVDVLLSVIVF